VQFQADILGIPVDVPVITETTALGSAFLAALGMGDFNNLDEIAGIWKLDRTYEPEISADRRQALGDRWQKAVARCKDWAE
jgi:glycerol kinase